MQPIEEFLESPESFSLLAEIPEAILLPEPSHIEEIESPQEEKLIEEKVENKKIEYIDPIEKLEEPLKIESLETNTTKDESNSEEEKYIQT